MARDFTSAQFDASKYSEAQNRAYAVLSAVCGPEVAAAFARYYGKSIDPDDIVNTARTYGLWTAQTGMRGPQAQKKLLDTLGIPVQFSPEVNVGALQQAMAEGRTGALSTPNHYFFLQGYNPQTGQYDTGQSGSVYKGGGRYLTLDQIKALGGGIQGQFLANPSDFKTMEFNYARDTPQPSPDDYRGIPGARAMPYVAGTPSPGMQLMSAKGGGMPTGMPNLTGRSPMGPPQGPQLPRPTGPINAPSGSVNYDDKEGLKQYIRFSAAQRGIDPEVAVRVAQSEGLNTYVGDSGSSFGPYQLHYGNVASGGNRVGGLGDTFTKTTGLDARDPTTIQQQIDFTLDQVRKGGWGPWHGAKAAGIGAYQGVGTYNGDPSQFGNYPTFVEPTAPAPSAGFTNAGGPTGLPSVRMGSVVNMGGQEYGYPTSPTVAPPLTQDIWRY